MNKIELQQLLQKIEIDERIHDWSGAVKISKDAINDLIVKSIKEIQKGDNNITFIATGDTLVLINKTDGTYNIEICKVRYTLYINEKELEGI
jgi:hypothetical protein